MKLAKANLSYKKTGGVVIVVERGKFLREAELWNNEPPSNSSVDVIHHIYRDQPVPNAQSEICFTIILDLRKSEDEIFQNFGSNEKYEIRRAEARDQISHFFFESSPPLDDFWKVYWKSSRAKNYPIIPKRVLDTYAKNSSLILSVVKNHAGMNLSWYAYLVSNRSAVLIAAVSDTDIQVSSSVRGRANRLHHWKNILAFKSRGFESYDFGGWYEKYDDSFLIGINQFKEGFGGRVTAKFNSRLPSSWRGRLFLNALQIRKKWHGFRQKKSDVQGEIGKKGLVSALITVFNGELYIEEAVASLQKQTYADLEIIIVDDGSTDATPKILQTLASSDKRIRVFSPGRLGRARALNLGIAVARGEYVSILDADDLTSEDRILKQVEFLEQHTDHGMVGAQFRLTTPKGEEKLRSAYALNDSELRKALTIGQCFAHPSITFRKSLLEKLGGYNTGIKFLLDRDIFIRAAQFSKVANLPEVLTTVRHHEKRFFFYTFSTRHREILHNWMRLKAIRRLGFSYLEFVKPSLGILLALIPYRLRLGVPAGVKTFFRSFIYPTDSTNLGTYSQAKTVKYYEKLRGLQKPEETILSWIKSRYVHPKVLDIGVGGGRTTHAFSSVASEYIGGDYSEKMILSCQQNFKNHSLKFLKLDARDLSVFPESYFDFVLFSFNGLDYLSHEDRRIALKELFRVIKQGGSFAFSSHNLQSVDRLLDVKFSWRLDRTVRQYFISRRILELNSSVFTNRDAPYAIVNDGAHGYGLKTYYVKPEFQLEALRSAGFKDIRLLSLETGREIDLSSKAIEQDPWIYYWAEK